MISTLQLGQKPYRYANPEQLDAEIQQDHGAIKKVMEKPSR
jgi:hypothetical protein